MAADLDVPSDKSAYRIPTMGEIREVPDSGLRAVSTFSGCGGSCLGLRMAGYRVLWASEFIPAARDVYRLNHPDSILDERDIREVRPEDILEATGLQPGEIDLLEGSPPCASFSTSGKRHRHWGEVRPYSDTKQRTDDLFDQFIRILSGLQPRVFLAENVSGLVKGVAKGYFLEILARMKAAGYRVEARLLDAQWLGVPQARQRVIFQGIREDLNAEHAWPEPLPYRYSIADACPWIVASGGIRGTGQLRNKTRSSSEPVQTIMAGGGGSGNSSQFGVMSDPSIADYAIGDEYDNVEVGKNSDRYQNLSRASPQRPCPTVTAGGGTMGAAAVVHPYEKRKFTIEELKRLSGFPEDFELTGSYAQQWERIGRSVPPLMMRAIGAAVRDGPLGSV